MNIHSIPKKLCVLVTLWFNILNHQGTKTPSIIETNSKIFGKSEHFSEA